MPKHWLFKTEPGTFSISQLKKERKTNWNGVRNFQARNFLKETAPGDKVLIYHSGEDKAVVGVAHVTRGAYADPDPQKPGEWVQIDLEYESTFERSVPLQEIKAQPELSDLPLIKQSRLSCMPITAKHFQLLSKLGKKP